MARISSAVPASAVTLGLAALLAFTASPSAGQVGLSPPADVFEVGIPELQQAMEEGRLTAMDLVDAYMARIRAYDQDGPGLNAILVLNPLAHVQAAALDAERAERGPRGPLHGIPVLLKDNIDTADLPTSAASWALAGSIPPDDARVVERLRGAGAVILGKTNLHELAIGITTLSSLDGQTRNPYDPSRNPGGSSGGTGAAVAASFAALGYATDTCGSIRIPAAFNGLFGLRPTHGLVSTDGMIPLAHTQDVIGPMARTVTDLAIGLDAVVDPEAAAVREAAGALSESAAGTRFVEALREDALGGARIGVLDFFLDPILYREDIQALFGDPRDLQANSDDIGPDLLEEMRRQAEESREATAVIRGALDGMRALGAEIVEISAPRLDTLLEGTDVIDYEFKFDLRDYLAATPDAPVDSLGDILERGLYHPSLEATLRRRNAVASRDEGAYRTALSRRSVVAETVLRLMDAQGLDALVYPTMRREPAPIGEPQKGSTCQLSATTGFPALSMPAGFGVEGLPVGFELLGRPLEDARLLGFAYAYEQAVAPRRPPPTTPRLPAAGGALDGGGR